MWLLLTCPLLETWPATQACALTGNRTGDLLVCRPAPSPLSHTSQGSNENILNAVFIREIPVETNVMEILLPSSGTNGEGAGNPFKVLSRKK